MKKRIKKHVGVHHINTPKTFILAMLILISGAFAIYNSINLYKKLFQTDITIEKSEEIDFTQPVAIYFSQPMRTDKFDGAVTISPDEKFEARWISNKKLSIIPKESWEAQTAYEINIPASMNAMMVKSPGKSFTFSTKNFPQVAHVTPEDGAANTVIDIEDPIVVDFDRSTSGFLVKFKIDPASAMAYQNNKEKTQFQLLPKSKLVDDTTYNFNVYVKKASDPDENYREIYAGSFKTPPPPVIVWEKDFSLRLEQARRVTRARIASGKYIDINLNAQILSTFEEGKLLTASMISSGKRGMETPKGQFAIKNKAPRVWSKKYSLYMPYWMAVASDGSFGIHELPEWPGGYKEGAAHLGIPVSHGCIRLGIGPAKEVFDWTEVGTPVVIY